MTIPSFAPGWKDLGTTTPRISVLAVSKPDDPDGAPIAWVLVEREEKYRYDERDGSVYEACIEFSCVAIDASKACQWQRKTTFSGSYRAAYDGSAVSLTSSSMGRGAVFMDLAGLKGHRIGTYLMNEIVLWARQWPAATVRQIELLANQAYDENRTRRNRFYEQFGLVFDFQDVDHAEGISRPMSAKSLTPIDTWKANLRVLRVDEYLEHMLFENSRQHAELERCKFELKEMKNERRSAERRPLRWATQRLWWRYSSSLFYASPLFCVVLIVWWKCRSIAT